MFLDPRQARALALYKDPASDTFSNLRRSLINAGYDEKYADTIAGREPKWLTENIKDTVALVTQAEQNLKAYVEMSIPLHSESNKTEVDIAKMKLDASKFILKNLASGKYKSAPDQQDATRPITVNIIKYNDDKRALPDVQDAIVIDPLDEVQE